MERYAVFSGFRKEPESLDPEHTKSYLLFALCSGSTHHAFQPSATLLASLVSFLSSMLGCGAIG